MIKGLHHNAYRCRDSEETRVFYEEFLGLPLADAFEITESKSGRKTSVLHSFYRLGDGSYLAFFDVPNSPFEFKAQHDYDLHIALEVDPATLDEIFEKSKAAGIETTRRRRPWLHSLDVHGVCDILERLIAVIFIGQCELMTNLFIHRS